MTITIDKNYKVSDEALLRFMKVVSLQECGKENLQEATAFTEHYNGMDKNWNYGIGNFTTRDGGMDEFMPFLKKYYPSLYKQLRNDCRWESTTFEKSWINLGTGKDKKKFMMAQIYFLWYYDGVKAIKTLNEHGCNIKLDGSRPEGFFALLCMMHNQAPAWIYCSNSKKSWWNAMYNAMKKYPKAKDSMDCIKQACANVYNNYNGYNNVANGWKKNSSRCTALTTPLKSIANGGENPIQTEDKDNDLDIEIEKDTKPTKLDSPIWGIDVSKYNAPINFKNVKAAGVKFVILRCGYTSLSDRNSRHVDTYFETYYNDAKEADLPVGAYYYSRCNSEETAKAEAKVILDAIKDKQFEYPIFLDVEDETTLNSVNKSIMTNAVVTCMQTIKDAGYYVGIYTRASILSDNLNDSSILKKFDYWIASWTKTCAYTGEYTMWQWSGETNALGKPTKVSGIGSDVADQSYCYIDYPTYIKNVGLNGFKATNNTDDTDYDKTYTGTVSGVTKALNVRSGGSTSYPIIGVLMNNDTVTIVAKTSSGWYKIKYNSSYGYVSSKYITDVKEDTSDITIDDNDNEDNLPDKTYEQTIKACNVTAQSFVGISSKALVEKIVYDDNKIEDTKYPADCNYIFIDFSNVSDVEDEKTLARLLLSKYPNKPVFLAKTNNADYDAKLQAFVDVTANTFLIDTTVYSAPTTEEETESYYAKIKEIVSKTCIGWKKKETPSGQQINEELKPNGNKSFGKVSSIYCTLPDKADKSFYTRYSFETVDEIKYQQDIKVYLEGDDCINGQLVPVPNSKYEITILYNPDTIKNGGLMYYGVVTKVKTGSYEDFTDSIVRKDVQIVLKGYFDNYKKFTYRSKKTCVSYKNPDANKDNWVVAGSKVGDPGRYYIDCSTLAKLFLMGLNYGSSPFVKKTTNLVRNSKYSWSFNYDEIPRTAADQAEWCVKQGYALYGIDTENYSNLEEGDLIFYDRDSDDNGRFMNISHVAIVYKIENDIPYIIQSSHLKVNGVWDDAINVKKVADNTPNNIVLFARIKKY